MNIIEIKACANETFILKLKNIGPFQEQSVSFEKDDVTSYPVVVITGENGTGKSIVVDAIRTVLRGLYGIEREYPSERIHRSTLYDFKPIRIEIKHLISIYNESSSFSRRLWLPHQ